MVKNSPASAGDVGDVGSIPGSGRSPRGGHGNPLQFSEEAGRLYIVHGVTKSWTQQKQQHKHQIQNTYYLSINTMFAKNL